jgi:hypothetical protein
LTGLQTQVAMYKEALEVGVFLSPRYQNRKNTNLVDVDDSRRRTRR